MTTIVLVALGTMYDLNVTQPREKSKAQNKGKMKMKLEIEENGKYSC